MDTMVGRPIVAGVDGSDSARLAASWAADEAARRNVTLRLVAAVHLPVVGYGGAVGPAVDYTDDLRADAAGHLDGLRSAILTVHPDLEVDIRVRTGPSASALIEESSDALLMVLGSRGLGGFTGVLVGSTAVVLVAHGHCPVAVIRPGTADGPVVVGVDGSPASETAVALAFDEASLRGAELVAVHTWLDYGPYAPYAVAEIDWDAVDQRQQELLAQRLAGWQEKYPDVTVRRVVRQDRPARSLLEQAAHAQLLVVGSRGRGGFTGMLVGSTSQALVYHAPCPLLVARPAAVEEPTA
ncbi:MAG TPA: universal stress protein [Pseudonocardiaceae bacterium]|nr:universal stress protein [Pseudonocardiaceae bacterium]